MANSMFIPLLRLPQSFLQLKECIAGAFVELDYATPEIEFKLKQEGNNGILDDFILIHGNGADEVCWISINEAIPDITGNIESQYLASVTTRTDWLFASVVAYALCSDFGYIVFNDSGQFDRQEEFSAASLKLAIEKMRILKRLRE